MKFIKPTKISLKTHSVLNEAWLQDIIAKDPSILGFGDVSLLQRERLQPRAGRFDLLLVDPETRRRYEVEIQLGASDESHIIRTIEYWDNERKRYPNHDHCAVIVAEDITTRFLNVISLFNGNIPLIALQLTAFEQEGGVGLIFTRVLDEVSPGMAEDEEEAAASPMTRSDWETKASPQTVKLADQILENLKEVDQTLELNFTKHYIGLKRSGMPFNFLTFVPKKQRTHVAVKLPKTTEVDQIIENSGIEKLQYDSQWHNYRLALAPDELKTHRDLILRLGKSAYELRCGKVVANT